MVRPGPQWILAITFRADLQKTLSFLVKRSGSSAASRRHHTEDWGSSPSGSWVACSRYWAVGSGSQQPHLSGEQSPPRRVVLGLSVSSITVSPSHRRPLLHDPSRHLSPRIRTLTRTLHSTLTLAHSTRVYKHLPIASGCWPHKLRHRSSSACSSIVASSLFAFS